MVVVIKSELIKLWNAKQEREGRVIKVSEVAEATKVDRRSITRLLKGKPEQFQAKVIGPLCEYFEVPHGQPIPFLIVCYNGNEEDTDD